MAVIAFHLAYQGRRLLSAAFFPHLSTLKYISLRFVAVLLTSFPSRLPCQPWPDFILSFPILHALFGKSRYRKRIKFIKENIHIKGSEESIDLQNAGLPP
jgi:hypothetical protein